MNKPQTAATAQMQAISVDFVSRKINRKQALSAFIDVIVQRNRCSRVSLWRFDGHADRLGLLCFAAKSAGGELVTEQSRLEQAEFRDYFGALVSEGVYVSNDALHDPHLQAMRDSYLLRHGVLSTLDAAFMLNGRIHGVICCEQTDAVRTWRADEVVDLRAHVAKLAMLMAAANDPALRDWPSLPMVPMLPPARGSQDRRR